MQRVSSFDRVRAAMAAHPASVPQPWPGKWRSRYWTPSSMPDFAKASRGLKPAATSWESQLAQFAVAGCAQPAVSLRSVLPPGEIRSTALGSHYFIHAVYPEDHFHGKVRLSRFSSVELAVLMSLMHENGSV